MNDKLRQRLSKLPNLPGIYFFKDKKNQIIYIGKAASLKSRVRQYFQESRHRDPKTDLLVSEIQDIDWSIVETELDALFLEAEMVRRYMPRYNILLRDDKSSVYVVISYSSPHPTISFTRRPIDDDSRYFGPYFNANQVKKALHYLRRIFPYSTHTDSIPKRVCLQYHLGLCPGLEEGKMTLTDYRANLRKIMQYLKGERADLIGKIEKEMVRAGKKQDYESAAKLRDQLLHLRNLSKQIIFSRDEFLDISKDRALDNLTRILGLKKFPKRIEGYDISHMQGVDNVASMVVFTNGIPHKVAYRKFKMNLPGNDDFAHMHETLLRRFSDKNTKAWGMPDLILIDGGKGQLNAAIKALKERKINCPIISLAKREEEIIINKLDSNTHVSISELKRLKIFVKENEGFLTLYLSPESDLVKLLQRVRDESHRFAVSYHSVLKVKRQTSSLLDNIPGFGPKTRQKILKHFGSQQALKNASLDSLTSVLGQAKAEQVINYIKDKK